MKLYRERTLALMGGVPAAAPNAAGNEDKSHG